MESPTQSPVMIRRVGEPRKALRIDVPCVIRGDCWNCKSCSYEGSVFNSCDMANMQVYFCGYSRWRCALQPLPRRSRALDFHNPLI